MDVIDVTDETFQTEVLDRSHEVPVVIDLWASWCGPCRTLGPVIERAVAATNGAVQLVKVDVDANRSIAEAFKVQSIPAVYVMKDGQVIDGFIGALPEQQVREFVNRLAPMQPNEAVADEGAAGGEGWVEDIGPRSETGDNDTELDSVIDLAAEGVAHREDLPLDIELQLDTLLEHVKNDEHAREQFLKLLELLGPEDSRTGIYRKALAARLF